MSVPATTPRPWWRGQRTWVGVCAATALIAGGVVLWRILPDDTQSERTVDTDTSEPTADTEISKPTEDTDTSDSTVVIDTSEVTENTQASDVLVDNQTWYVLVNRRSGKALDVEDRAVDEGAKVTQQARNGGPSQQWQFIDAGGGHYRLRNQHSNKVLDVAEYSPDDGADILQWKDLDGANQRFRLAEADDGYVRLINFVSGKSVSVKDSSTANGADVQQWTDRNGANQQWQLVPVGSGAYPEPRHVTGDLGVHDPSVVKRSEGSYLLASTGPDIGLKTSTDLVAWTDVGTAFPDGAPWTYRYTDGERELWAPDISYRDGVYYLYYSASTFGSNMSAIFLATSPTGDPGSWVHEGKVVESRGSDDFNAIDPHLLVDDEGRWWLSFGSYWSGIKMVELDPATGMRVDDRMLSIASRDGRAVEAPYIVKHGDHYYLYLSFDSCCAEAASDYRVMVGRSKSVTGPYADRHGVPMMDGGGTEILAGHGGVNGPGHQAVLADPDGDHLIYHYYPDNGEGPTRCGYCTLGINRIRYDGDGWPAVR